MARLILRPGSHSSRRICTPYTYQTALQQRIQDGGYTRGQDIGSCTVDPTDPRGEMDPILDIFDPKHTIPIRARAYNDCVQLPILLKTRSSGVQDTPT